MISTWSPDVAKQILLDREDNFVKPKTFGGEFVALVKNSILQVEGQEWKKQKQIIGPAFHYDHLQGLIPRFNEIAQNLAEGWKPTAMDRTPIDITRWINLYIPWRTFWIKETLTGFIISFFLVLLWMVWAWQGLAMTFMLWRN
jgi:hypothetical protein